MAEAAAGEKPATGQEEEGGGLFTARERREQNDEHTTRAWPCFPPRWLMPSPRRSPQRVSRRANRSGHSEETTEGRKRGGSRGEDHYGAEGEKENRRANYPLIRSGPPPRSADEALDGAFQGSTTVGGALAIWIAVDDSDNGDNCNGGSTGNGDMNGTSINLLRNRCSNKGEGAPPQHSTEHSSGGDNEDNEGHAGGCLYCVDILLHREQRGEDSAKTTKTAKTPRKTQRLGCQRAGQLRPFVVQSLPPGNHQLAAFAAQGMHGDTRISDVVFLDITIIEAPRGHHNIVHPRGRHDEGRVAMQQGATPTTARSVDWSSWPVEEHQSLVDLTGRFHLNHSPPPPSPPHSSASSPPTPSPVLELFHFTYPHIGVYNLAATAGDEASSGVGTAPGDTGDVQATCGGRASPPTPPPTPCGKPTAGCGIGSDLTKNRVKAVKAVKAVNNRQHDGSGGVGGGVGGGDSTEGRYLYGGCAPVVLQEEGGEGASRKTEEGREAVKDAVGRTDDVPCCQVTARDWKPTNVRQVDVTVARERNTRTATPTPPKDFVAVCSHQQVGQITRMLCGAGGGGGGGCL